MKNIYLIIFLALISCSSHKNTNKITEIDKIKTYITSQNFTLTIPNNWKSVSDHSFVSYTPKNLGDIFYKNTVRVFNITPKEKTTLKKVTENKINSLISNIKINSQEITKNETRFGITYTHHYKHSWNFTNYEVITRYFEVNENYYSFSYSSDERFQKKYLNDANSIFKSFKIKDTLTK